MEYQNLVRDFAYRTKANLDSLRKIQKTTPNIEVYEVTQLINSMLGLLIFPRQQFIDQIPDIKLEELKRKGWPVPKVIGNYPQITDLKTLVRYLRNSIAHFNIEFVSDSKGELNGLRVWNVWDDKITWKAEMSIKDIEELTEKFIKLIL